MSFANRLLKADAIASVPLLVFAILFWFAADLLPKSSLSGGVGADGLPKLLAILLAFLSLLLLASTLFSRKPAAVSEEAGPNWKDHLSSLGILVIGLIATWLLPIIGYPATVALLLISMALYHGQKMNWTLALYGLCGAALMYVVFEIALRVPMPNGFWPKLLGL